MMSLKFDTLLNLGTGKIKNSTPHLLKINRSQAISRVHKKVSFQSLQMATNNLEMFVISYNNI